MATSFTNTNPLANISRTNTTIYALDEHHKWLQYPPNALIHGMFVCGTEFQPRHRPLDSVCPLCNKELPAIDDEPVKSYYASIEHGNAFLETLWAARQTKKDIKEMIGELNLEWRQLFEAWMNDWNASRDRDPDPYPSQRMDRLEAKMDQIIALLTREE